MTLAGDLPDDLLGALARTAERSPGRGILFTDRRGRPGELRSWAALQRTWKRAAGRVASLVNHERRPVFVCLPASWEFLDVWFGALLAGAYPVAVAPPSALGASGQQFRVLAELTTRLDPPLVVASELTVKRAAELGEAELAARMTTSEAFAARDVSRGGVVSRTGEDVAFLQFTSGSTGLPRAVSISHRAAVATTEAIADATPRPQTRDAGGALVSWLPLHHDMGLVGCLLFSLVQGHSVWFHSQRAFLGRPESWLHAISAADHVFSGAPNFAYQTLVDRAEAKRLEGVDLSNWAATVTGAEMVRPATSAAFCERFAPLGFDRAALVAAYGMAETTLTVSMDKRREGVRSRPAPEGSTEAGDVASCGAPVLGMEVRVSAPDGSALPEETVGEVCTRGDGLFSGYHDDAEATAECVRDGWLHTGDLGFVADGELYLTGRIKDLIIVGGDNVMPTELERHAEEASGGGGTCRTGAFAVPAASGTEAAVLVIEVDPESGPDLDGITADVRRRIGRDMGLPLADVAFVRRGEIPKTSSGKVKRGELRRRYLAREIARLDAPESRPESG